MDKQYDASYMINGAEVTHGNRERLNKGTITRIAAYANALNAAHINSILGENSSESDVRIDTPVYDPDKIPDINVEERIKILTRLPSLHSSVWHISQYYYEKASKILCQMLASVIDCLLWEKGNMTVLYEEGPIPYKTGIIEEMERLSRDYQRCVYYLITYDFLTLDILPAYTRQKDYKRLSSERDRLKTNGLPEKVSRAIEMLSAGNDENSELASELAEMFIPDPPAERFILEDLYQRLIEESFKDENDAISHFVELFLVLSQEIVTLYLGD